MKKWILVLSLFYSFGASADGAAQHIPDLAPLLFNLKSKLCEIPGYKLVEADVQRLGIGAERIAIRTNRNGSQELTIEISDKTVKKIEWLASGDKDRQSFMVFFMGKGKRNFLLSAFLSKSTKNCYFSEIERYFSKNERRDGMRILKINALGEIASKQYDYAPPKTLREIYQDQPLSQNKMTITKNPQRVLVGVVDSGIDYNHPGLADKIERRYSPGEEDQLIDSAKRTMSQDEVDLLRVSLVGGVNTSEQELGPYDNDGIHYELYSPAFSTHGTQVSHVLVDGTNGEISLLPARIPPGFSGHRNGFSEAIDELVKRGARVINLSLGWKWYQRFLVPNARRTIEKHSNVLFVVAAGNSGRFARDFPAKFQLPNVIVVGASQENGEWADYSNFGTFVDVAARGSYDLYITGGVQETSWTMGTSFAAPSVARTAALMLYQNPNLTPTELKQILCSTVDLKKEMKKRTRCGGTVNEGNALAGSMKK